MGLLWLFLALQQARAAAPPDRLWQQVMESLDRSGRAAEIVAPVRERIRPPKLAPGAPPLLSFRYLEGKRRHRFGELGLVIDDAGH